MADAELRFKDQGQLEAWLREQPRQFSVVIAARAALRVWPFLRGIPAGFDIPGDILRHMRAAHAAWVAARFPPLSKPMNDSVQAAFQAAGIRGIGTDAAMSASFALQSALASTASTTNEAAAEMAFRAVASSQEVFARGGSDGAVAWDVVHRDAEALAGGQPPTQIAGESLWWGDPPDAALWWGDPPDAAAETWGAFKSELTSRDHSGEWWGIWADWYDARLNGGPTWPDLSSEDNAKLEVAIATLPERLWERGPGAVNTEIANLIGLRRDKGADAVTARLEELHEQDPDERNEAVYTWGGPSRPDSFFGSGGRGPFGGSESDQRETEAATTATPESAEQTESDAGITTDGAGGKPPDGKGTGTGAVPETQFVADDAEVERDDLGRGVLAIALARRLHRIWCHLNGAMPREPQAVPPAQSALQRTTTTDSARWTGMVEDESCFFDRGRDNTRAAFVLHLDAPWGGGKTTFANFLARVLNPTGYKLTAGSFLKQRYADAESLETIFLADPPAEDEAGNLTSTGDGTAWPEDARRPWIIVPFNAWQVEHCSPPWWVFYQTIRKRCLSSILCEGDRPAGETPTEFGGNEKLGKWLRLQGHEYWWRITNPKVVALLLTASVSLATLLILLATGIIHQPKEGGLAFNLGTGAGLLLVGLTTLSTIWGFGAVFTESIRPGTDTVAERLSLGKGDPLERFREHFFKTMERVKRPVMVIVDDLDRCKPDYIVDLVRGMQTLLRSPRVVFVVLGDRDWIERAFEAHHKAMAKVSVGPEQTFGARFVEKAIQMSFILPGMRDERRQEYVRGLLLGRRVVARGAAVLGPAPAIAPKRATKIRQAIETAAEEQKDQPLNTDAMRRRVLHIVEEPSRADVVHAAGDAAEPGAVEQFINEELAIRAAADEEVERAISHKLEPLAPFFPANPRQIKRIINAVTMYHAVALQQQGLQPADPRWFQLALWVIVMTEWPKTWHLLASYPAIADLLASDNPGSLFDSAAPNDLPASRKATLEEVARIRADASLMALIAGGGRPEGRLDRQAIEALMALTPLHSRKVVLDGNGEGEAVDE